MSSQEPQSPTYKTLISLKVIHVLDQFGWLEEEKRYGSMDAKPSIECRRLPVYAHSVGMHLCERAKLAFDRIRAS